MRISDWSSDVCSSDLDVPGAIPIPATLSIEFGEVIGAKAGIVGYRFVSDYPFANRASHELDAFERRALETFRQSRRPDAAMSEATGSLINRRIRRSEEHTSELQSLMRISYAVFCLKKKNQHNTINTNLKSR